MAQKKTTHIRVYTDDLKEIKTKFPDVRMADFFNMTIKSNPFIQLEAILRGKKKKVKRK